MEDVHFTNRCQARLMTLPLARRFPALAAVSSPVILLLPPVHDFTPLVAMHPPAPPPPFA
eukprot:28987-Pleurochrysis_carterae.AAC.3